MVEGKYKSRKYRKIYRKTPGGRIAVYHVQRKTSMARCAKCGRTLKGMKSALRALPKSDKRTSRIFGGSLCGNCSIMILRIRAREL